MENSSIPFDPHDRAQLSKFRLLIAGIFRDLLTAWKQAAPTSFDPQLAAVWNQGRPATDAPALIFLNNAYRNTQRFYDDYGGYQDSVPCAAAGETVGIEAAFQQIRDLVIDSLDPELLQSAISAVRRKDPFDWHRLVSWQALPELRRLLNQLPRIRSQVSRERVERITDLRTLPPDSIVFADNPKFPASPQEWRLLNHLLQQPDHVSAIDEFAEPVWEDHSVTVDKEALKAVLKRLRRIFRVMNAPFAISLRNGYVELSRAPELPTRKVRKLTRGRVRDTRVSKGKQQPKR